MIKKVITLTLQRNILAELSDIRKYLGEKLTIGNSVIIQSLTNANERMEFNCNGNDITKDGIGLTVGSLIKITVNCDSEEIAEDICKRLLKAYGNTDDIILEEIRELRKENASMKQEISNLTHKNDLIMENINKLLICTTASIEQRIEYFEWYKQFIQTMLQLQSQTLQTINDNKEYELGSKEQ